MSISTEKTVREEIVTAIKTVANEKLGYALHSTPNIHEYLLEFEQPEYELNYLVADTVEGKKVRAWGVQVVGDDDYYNTGGITIRNYTVIVQGYYDLGIDGAGVNTLIEHTRAVRRAILDIGSNLNHTVDRTTDMTPLSLGKQLVEGYGAQVVIGRFVLTAEKRNPGF